MILLLLLACTGRSLFAPKQCLEGHKEIVHHEGTDDMLILQADQTQMIIPGTAPYDSVDFICDKYKEQ